jgi:hypothetical protein
LWNFFYRLYFEGDPKSWIGGIGQYVLIILLFVLSRWIVMRLKERWTYQRTGYVSYQRPRLVHRVLQIVVACLVGVVGAVGIVIANEAFSPALVPVVVGLFFALISVWLAFRYGIPRFFWVAIGALIFGVGGSLLHLPGTLGVAVALGGFGLVWITSGAITLVRYLRATQPLEEGDL